jgi:hypothetical protein
MLNMAYAPTLTSAICLTLVHADLCPARPPHLATIFHEGSTSMILVPAEAKSYKTRQARQLSAR